MSDWPDVLSPAQGVSFVINPLHRFSIGAAGFRAVTGNSLNASTAWPAANRAIYIPFRIPCPMIAYQMVVGCGATASGNFDVGIYDYAGNRLVNSGAQSKVASAEVICNITDTPLGPGSYWMAMSVDSTAAIIAASTAGVSLSKFLGVMTQDTAYTLPATATFATANTVVIPAMSVWLRAN